MLTDYLPPGWVGEDYSAQMKALVSPYREVVWSVNESTPLPFGLDMDVNGHIYGVPVKKMRTSVQIFVAAQDPPERAYTILNIAIYMRELTVISKDFVCIAGRQCSLPLVAVGGRPPYLWSCDSLPAGLALSGSEIEGTAEFAGGIAPVNVSVVDSCGTSASTTVFIKIERGSTL